MIEKQRIIAKNVGKKFRIGFKKNQGALARAVSLFSGKEPKRTIWALKDISFKVNSGEILGIIGKNGAGKSTLLRCISKIYKIDVGIIRTNGKIISLINLNVGMQHRLTMRDNIYLCCCLFGLSKREVMQNFNSIVEFSGLQDFVETKVYQFSDGMRQRLAFSIAMHCNPDILLLDEVFATGDEDFRNKSSEKIKELVKMGVSVILVSHELWMIEKYCSRVIWLENGRINREGDTKQVVKEYHKNE